MPHTFGPEPIEHEPGAQWAASAETSTSRTSSHYRGGRGFAAHDCSTGQCAHAHHHARPDDTSIVISRVLARLKAGGAAAAPRMLR